MQAGIPYVPRALYHTGEYVWCPFKVSGSHSPGQRVWPSEGRAERAHIGIQRAIVRYTSDIYSAVHNVGRSSQSMMLPQAGSGSGGTTRRWSSNRMPWKIVGTRIALLRQQTVMVNGGRHVDGSERKRSLRIVRWYRRHMRVPPAARVPPTSGCL